MQKKHEIGGQRHKSPSASESFSYGLPTGRSLSRTQPRVSLSAPETFLEMECIQNTHSLHLFLTWIQLTQIRYLQIDLEISSN
jgi:hypothetical protein